MGDDDRGGRDPDRDRDRDHGRDRNRGDDRGWGVRLPPIRLPPLFPEELRLVLPAWTRVSGAGSALLAAAALDALDALAFLALGGGPGPALARASVGTALAAALAWPVGLLYAWEAAAAVAAPPLGVAPSATLAVLLDARLRGR